jgi:hypothetical protein
LVAVEEFAVVVAAAERIRVEKEAFLAEGKLAASKLFAVPPHTSAGLVADVRVVVGVVRNLDIADLAQEHLVVALAFEILAYAVADCVDGVAY